MSDTTVFAAREILTMDPTRPRATHVAVRDGRILAVGGADCAVPWGGGRVDDRFRDAVLTPGLIEGHSHVLTGTMWRYPYVGYHDRTDHEGRLWKGVRSTADVVAVLKRAEADMQARGAAPDEPMLAWGYDPVFFGGDDWLGKAHLDRVSSTRPIVIQHITLHLLTANSPALALAGYDRETTVEGVIKTADGDTHGEVREMGAMFPLLRRTGVDFRDLSSSEKTLRDFAALCRLQGVTTATDLHARLTDPDVDNLLRVTGADDYSLRIVSILGAAVLPPKDVAPRALALAARSADRLRLGAVKLIIDGAIQGFTARMRWPGWFQGGPNGQWVIEPERAEFLIDALHRAGVQMHVHINGDEAADVTLDIFSRALDAHRRTEHRHVMQHCQTMDRHHFRRMKLMGLTPNVFVNHVWYYGDIHRVRTLGPERAERISACRSLIDEGLALAIHSDSPVTHLSPLFTAWVAVNRRTISGRELGPEQRVTPLEAMQAITTGAAYTLKMEHEIGSVSVGKKADLAILDENPLTVDPMEIKDIPVRGVIMGGRVFA